MTDQIVEVLVKWKNSGIEIKRQNYEQITSTALKDNHLTFDELFIQSILL